MNREVYDCDTGGVTVLVQVTRFRFRDHLI